MDENTREPRARPEPAKQVESLTELFAPSSTQLLTSPTPADPAFGALTTELHTDILASVPYGSQIAEAFVTSQYQGLPTSWQSQPSVRAPFSWTDAPDDPTQQKATSTSGAQPSIPASFPDLHQLLSMPGRPEGALVGDLPETSQGLLSPNPEHPVTIDSTEALAGVPNLKEYMELFQRHLMVLQTLNTTVSAPTATPTQLADNLPLSPGTVTKEAAPPACWLPGSYHPAPSPESPSPGLTDVPGDIDPRQTSLLQGSSTEVLSSPRGDLSSPRGRLMNWLSAPASGLNPAIVRKALGTAGPGLDSSPAPPPVEAQTEGDQPGDIAALHGFQAWNQILEPQKKGTKLEYKRKAAEGQQPTGQPALLQGASASAVRELASSGSKRRRSGVIPDALPTPTDSAPDDGGQATQDPAHNMLLEGSAGSQPSSGGTSAAGDQSLLAPPLSEGESPSTKEKEEVISPQARRKERRKKLRELRTKPCGCTQDWPNDVQELRAKCNDQSREIFSMQMQREMLHRRDSQQVQEIEALKRRARELESALAKARDGQGARTEEEKQAK